MRTTFQIIVFIIGMTTWFACDIKDSDIEPGQVFTNVYDNGNFVSSFYPIDMKETTDGGFLILSAYKGDSTEYTWLDTYIMKADKEGNFEWEAHLGTPYVNPVGEIIEQNGSFYFFCMDNAVLKTYLMQIDESAGTATQVAVFDNTLYPLQAKLNADNSVLLLNYKRTSRSTGLTKMDASFNTLWQTQFGVIEDAEAKLITHISQRGKQFPFFIGEIGQGTQATHYYFNSFYNYSFSTLFVDAASGNGVGVVNGYRYEGGLTSALHLGGSDFAFTRSSSGENYLMPRQPIEITSISSAEDYAGTYIPEWTNDAKVSLKRMNINGKAVITFAAQTKTNQIALYFYDEAGGQLLNTKYLGNTQPVEIVSVLQSKDGNIAVLSRMFVAGRFPRIALFKITTTDLEL